MFSVATIRIIMIVKLADRNIINRDKAIKLDRLSLLLLFVHIPRLDSNTLQSACITLFV